MAGEGFTMKKTEIHAVTGAFGYSGKYIAKQLLDKGHEVITLTNSLGRPNPFGNKIKAYPFNFDNPAKLVESLRGVSVLYNNYWVRFNHRSFKHEQAVENAITLFKAAKEAGVLRIVHVSITKPEKNTHLDYFRGKALMEEALTNSGISYSILRPTVLFGKEDILINNIAWVLRHLPIFFTFGYGSYKLQPIYVDDLAELAVQQGKLKENKIINAVGPETFTYRELVETIGDIIGCTKPICAASPTIVYLAGCIISKFVNDVFITRHEIESLMSNLLVVDSAPTGKTKLTDWLYKHASTVGRKYTSELARRRDRAKEYACN